MTVAHHAAGHEREPVEPRDLLALAVDAARAAADLVRTARHDGLGEVNAKSTATDPVTAADKAAEELIVTRLRTARPGDQVLGEEYGERRVAPTVVSPVRWLIDPIDGTVNYVYNLPHYAVSIAAEVDGEVVAGVVRNAATGEEWVAWLGGGAWCDGRRLSGSSATTFSQALAATGFGYDPARRAHQARVLSGLLPHVRDIRRFGAASLDLCLVAEGKIDIYFEQGLNPWDHGAGGLIAAEAGLQVAGLRGAPAGPRMVVAAPPALFGELHDRLVALDADGGP